MGGAMPMTKFLSLLAALLLCCAVNAEAQTPPLMGVPGCGVMVPGGSASGVPYSNPCAPGVPSGSGAVTPQFFVAAPGNGGSDSNPGTQASPWATVAKVNSSATAGSTVKFNGGDSFSTTTGITALVNVTSYGTGEATISSGNSSAGVTWTNPGALSLTNIILTGGGNATNTTDCVLAKNTGVTKLSGLTISGVTCSGYGQNGIKIDGGTAGFTNFTLTNNIIHDVTGNTSTGNNTGAIEVQAAVSYGTSNINTNGMIQGNLVYNATGTAGSAPHWSGQGIVVSESQKVTIQYNVVHDFGANNTLCGGPVGIWSYDADQITIQFNEAYNGGSNYGAGGCDGDAYDHDGGTTNSVIQYNYGHDNVGNCVLYTAYADSTITTQANNTTRFNICQNNNNGNNGVDEIQLTSLSGATMTNPMVYNNVVYAGFGRAIGSAPAVSPGTLSGGFVANNILIGANGANIVTMPATGPAFTGNGYFCYPTLAASCQVNFSWNGTTYSGGGTTAANFASWQTATGQEKIAGVNVGQTVNPQINAPKTGLTVGGTGYVPGYLMGYNLQAGSSMVGGGVDVAATYSVSIGPQDYFGNSPGTKLIGAGTGTGSVSGACTAAINLLARMTSPTVQDQVLANFGACSLVNSGDFANLDVFQYWAFHSQTNGVLNFVSTSFNGVTGNSPTYTADQGFAGNGTNAYVAPSGYIPALGGTQLTLNSETIGVYDITSRTSGGNNASMGALSAGGSAYLGVWALTGTAPFFAANDATGGAATSITNSQGCTAQQRTAASGVASSVIYRNQTNVSGGGFNNASIQLPASVVIGLAFNNATSQPTITPVQSTTDTLSAIFAGNGSVSIPNVCAVLNTMNMAKGLNAY